CAAHRGFGGPLKHMRRFGAPGSICCRMAPNNDEGRVVPCTNRADDVISRRQFAMRVIAHLGLALAFVLASLVLSILGYMWVERGAHWHDVALNMAMIASGIGPTMLPETVQGSCSLPFTAHISALFLWLFWDWL